MYYENMNSRAVYSTKTPKPTKKIQKWQRVSAPTAGLNVTCLMWVRSEVARIQSEQRKSIGWRGGQWDSCNMSSSANLNCPTIVVNKEVGIGVFHDEVGVWSTFPRVTLFGYRWCHLHIAYWILTIDTVHVDENNTEFMLTKDLF